MTFGESAGYLASLLVFVTFYMKTMVPLRVAGILSNVAFLTYALIEHLVPIMILHGALLPLNLFRLYEILNLVGEIRGARSGDLALDALLPFMTRRRFKAGETLFRKGEPSHEMFYIREGVIRLDEIGRTIGESDVLGEISMFSPSRKRTATAVCETDGELLRMSDDQVLRLYHQNPSFGFYIVRLITRRLIENYEAFAAEQKPLEVGLRARNPSEDSPYRSGDKRPVPTSPARPVGRTRRKATWRLAGWALAAVALVAYAGWLFAPYLTSVVFRDAAVTTWINVATAPIRGNLDGPPPVVGQRLGADGRIATVRNLQADPSEMERAAAEVARAEANVAELQAYLARMQDLDAQWRTRTADYADTFKKNLEIEIDGARQELGYNNERLALERAVAERRQALARQGNASQTDADDALAEVMELERMRAELEKTIAHAQERREAADRGVFLAADGRNPEWAFQSEDRVLLELAQAKRALADAEADLAEARIAAAAAREAFELINASPITAPPGSLVWSVLAGAGSAVEPGAPVAEWIDCDVILVDVPASDVEVGLLREGMLADVVLEGETQVRQGRVLLSRGAASILDSDDLAAVAKGHGGGLGQVILSLEHTPQDAKECPIGVAAWVDFPEVDLIDELRARLRL
jgi:CRP-like cAMP-binding protein/multidrug resistance efflux pump